MAGCEFRIGVFLLVVESLSGLEVARGRGGIGWGEEDGGSRGDDVVWGGDLPVQVAIATAPRWPLFLSSFRRRVAHAPCAHVCINSVRQARSV